jgi:hypothetical protein
MPNFTAPRFWINKNPAVSTWWVRPVKEGFSLMLNFRRGNIQH